VQEIQTSRVVYDLVGTRDESGSGSTESSEGGRSKVADGLGQTFVMLGSLSRSWDVRSRGRALPDLVGSGGRVGIGSPERSGSVCQLFQRLSRSLVDGLDFLMSVSGGRTRRRTEHGSGRLGQLFERVGGVVVSRELFARLLGGQVSGVVGNSSIGSEDGRGGHGEFLERLGGFVVRAAGASASGIPVVGDGRGSSVDGRRSRVDLGTRLGVVRDGSRPSVDGRAGGRVGVDVAYGSDGGLVQSARRGSVRSRRGVVSSVRSCKRTLDQSPDTFKLPTTRCANPRPGPGPGAELTSTTTDRRTQSQTSQEIIPSLGTLPDDQLARFELSTRSYTPRSGNDVGGLLPGVFLPFSSVRRRTRSDARSRTGPVRADQVLGLVQYALVFPVTSLLSIVLVLVVVLLLSPFSLISRS
jgi:hypothetical protein